MQHSCRLLLFAPLRDPCVAAGVARGNDVGVCLLDVLDLAVEKSSRHLGLEHVINSRASAAHHRFRKLDVLRIRDGLDELPRG